MKIEPTKENEHVGIVRNERRGICVYVPRWWAGRRVRVTLEDAPDHIVDISKKVETEPKAAPDLLKALKDLFEHCAMIHKYWGDGSNTKEADAAIKSARAAIASATGQG